MSFTYSGHARNCIGNLRLQFRRQGIRRWTNVQSCARRKIHSISRSKALDSFLAFSVRLKPCPDTNPWPHRQSQVWRQRRIPDLSKLRRDCADLRPSATRGNRTTEVQRSPANWLDRENAPCGFASRTSQTE